MKLTTQEYKDLLKRNPALTPDIEVKSKSHYEDLDEAINAFKCAKSPSEAFFEEKPVKLAPTLKFTIPGQPVGSPRQTQRDKWMKRPCVVKYRDWCSKARASVPKGADLGLYREVTFIAYMGFPPTYSVNKKADLTNQPHLLKPDIDNISKSVLDALFEDDKVIYKLSAEKRWQDSKGPRIEVELR